MKIKLLLFLTVFMAMLMFFMFVINCIEGDLLFATIFILLWAWEMNDLEKYVRRILKNRREKSGDLPA